MHILVVNSGSSSIKYQLIDLADRSTQAAGSVEKIGEPSGIFTRRTRQATGELDKQTETLPIARHSSGFQLLLQHLSAVGAMSADRPLFGIGHRVVHGGEGFSAPARIDDRVLAGIRSAIPLAPLHNPANLWGIETMLELCPHVPQVAVFDTAFHQTMPPHAFHYAVPQELYEQHRVRRYGFHGTSHQYVSRAAAQFLGKPPAEVNLISLHLGNGASAAAIAGGRCIDTSMGLTPLEGLVMGTRCGDIDPAVVFFLARTTGRTLEELEGMLNRQSGLKGLCDVNDMREVLSLSEQGAVAATLALDMYCYRIRKYIGAYLAALGRVDAVLFTAGIGENSPAIRARVCAGLDGLGLQLDPARNAERSGDLRAIHTPGSPVQILVVPTNEELEIADQTRSCIAAG